MPTAKIKEPTQMKKLVAGILSLAVVVGLGAGQVFAQEG